MMKQAAPVMLVLLAIGGGASAQPPAEAGPDIEGLIKRLGDDSWRVREAATAKLIEIGRPALSALRKAILSDDAEVSTRAQFIYKRIVGVWPKQLEAFRKEIQLAFRAADYREMIQLAKRLTVREAGNLGDWLWLGHACQLAGKWKEAVAAYQNLLQLIDMGLKRRQTLVLPPPQEGEGRPELPAEWWGMLRQRTILAWRVSQMQRVELKDPKAAAAGLTHAVEMLEKARAEVDQLRLRVLRDLAAARQDGGDLAGAFAAWAKLQRACRGKPDWGGYVDVTRIADALAALPPGGRLPEIASIFVLTPGQPRTELSPNDPGTRSRSYYPSSNLDTPHWRYAFAPPPGKEFATLDFACDIEQLKPRCGGHLSCYVVTSGEDPTVHRLGSIGWGGDEPIGRKICRRKIEVPPGVRLVRITTGSWKGHFIVHGIQVKASFRPATKDAPRVRLSPHAWISVDALPAGGKLTCGARTLRPRSSARLPRGRYRLRYEVPGRTGTFEADVTLRAGGRCGVFANLDSPFRWDQTSLPSTHGWPPEPARISIARLPDGSYLAVWCARTSTIMLARSRDLLTWTRPEVAPFNSIFQDIAPATLAAPDGTVWVAFFSKRLTLQSHTTGGYSLFLTSTHDGRTWTPLRPVSIPTVDGWPVGAAQMLQGQDGRYWIFWRKYGAAGNSLGEVRELRPIQVEEATEKWLHFCQQHVTTDDQGLFHMVFSNSGQGIYHTTSADGLNWSAPQALVEKHRRRYLTDPQLILAKGKPLLLYEQNDGAYLVPAPLAGGPVNPGQGLKIVSHLVPLHGARARVTSDGEVLLLAGKNTSWLLRARLKDLAQLGAGR